MGCRTEIPISAVQFVYSLIHSDRGHFRETKKEEEGQNERGNVSEIEVDAAIALNLKEIELGLTKLWGELIGPQGHIIQSLTNPNGLAPQPLGKIATQTYFSDESCLTTEPVQYEW